MLILGTWAHAASPEALLLEIRVDGQSVSDGVGALRRGDEVLLPLGELARTLTLFITVSGQRADGYVLEEAREFHLDAARGEIVLSGRPARVDPARLVAEEGELYVPAALLAEWLPLELKIDLSALVLQVHPRETLPLQARLARRQRNPVLATAYADPGFPRLPIPYTLASTPFIDQTVSVDYRHGRSQAAYATYAAGDLLGMQANAYAAGLQGRGSVLRLTLGRYDPDAGLLGPLHARSALAGSVPAPAVAGVSNGAAAGNGVLLSNRPLFLPASFDRQTLQGELPPGWDVELFVNDALAGMQQSRADGQYRFDDIPLIYGDNDFRLVFHGPLGQTRVERQHYLLAQSLLAPGQVYYTATAQRDSEGYARAAVLLDAGLSGGLTVNAGAMRAPLLGTERSYVLAGLRQFWNSVIVDLGAVHDDRGGLLARADLKTRLGPLSVRASHAALRDGFASEAYLPSFDSLIARDELGIDGAPLPGLPLALLARRDRLASGAINTEAAARAAVYRNGFAFSNALHWQRAHGIASADGALQLSRRMADIGLSAQLLYGLAPQREWRSMAVSADKYFTDGYLASVGLLRSFHSSQNNVTVALNKSLGRFGMGLHASHATGNGWSAGLQLFFSLASEPRGSAWQASALPKSNTSAASVRVFLDKNLNGVMDADELPLANAGFTVNGAPQMVRTDAAGIVLLPRLPANVPTDIALDASTLDDPQWQPRQAGVRIVPRAGTVASFDVAVIATGEVDGTTYMIEEGKKRPLGDLQVEIVTHERKVVASTRSAGDGYFVMNQLVPGEYVLRISPEQTARLGLTVQGTQSLTIGPEGTELNGKELVVERQIALGK